MFNFVKEHLTDLKMFVRNKVVEMGTLTIQISISIQMVKPTVDTKVSCHASTKCKVFTTDITDDEVFDFVD